MSRESWSDTENDLIVSDYFDMLAQELSGESYNKAEHRRRLLPHLADRSEGSIEFKHQNISAVMLGMGQPRIEGYKPASQFQNSLVDAVWRRLESHPGWLNQPQTKRSRHGGRRLLRDPSTLWIGPPPTHSNAPPPVDPELLSAVARRFDVAARDEANRELGKAGEEYVLDYERFQLRAQNRSDLADRIVWTSRDEGDGAGYDIASFQPDGTPRLIEVKTTNGWERTPFHISRNELSVADRNRDTWHLLRLYEFAREPRAFELRPPLQDHVELTPTSFLASLH